MIKEFEAVEIIKLKQVVSKEKTEFGRVTSSFGLAQWLKQNIGDNAQEVTVLFCLNVNNDVTHFSFVNRGSNNQSIEHPRDFLQRALLSNAGKIVVAHNHPSGHSEPSKNDDTFTFRLQESCEIFGIHLLDHIIVTQNDYYSYSEHNKI